MRVRSHRHPDHTTEIVVAGELDLDTAPQLQQEIFRVLKHPGVRGIQVDLAEVTFCDSSGIAALDAGFGEAACNGITFRVVRVPAMIAAILQVVGLLQPLTRPGP
jgi:anti-sigma B factor antagonist